MQGNLPNKFHLIVCYQIQSWCTKSFRRIKMSFCCCHARVYVHWWPWVSSCVWRMDPNSSLYRRKHETCFLKNTLQLNSDIRDYGLRHISHTCRGLLAISNLKNPPRSVMDDPSSLLKEQRGIYNTKWRCKKKENITSVKLWCTAITYQEI